MIWSVSGMLCPKHREHGIGWRRRRRKTIGLTIYIYFIFPLCHFIVIFSFVDRVDSLKLSVYANAVLCLK